MRIHKYFSSFYMCAFMKSLKKKKKKLENTWKKYNKQNSLIFLKSGILLKYNIQREVFVLIFGNAHISA